MDPAYGEKYRELYQRHWWWRARTELIVKKLRLLRPANGWRRILDIGCGDALFFDRLAEYGEVEGVETSAELISANNPHRERIYIGPFDQSFQPRKQYSLILMLDVLEHLPDPVAAVRHVKELLEAGGTFVATVPAFMALWTQHDEINQHVTRYTKPRLREVVRDGGLRILEEQYFFHWTCPMKLAVGTLERIFRTKPKPADVPIKEVNELLYWVSRLEQKIVTPLSLPFGSSLLMIASK